ncbi:FACT complex subunit SSRP1 [Histomonas meleagridis]|uniref:FACT complex subunit SSRP1 n=1 Tax=Histomonas meleagridis TaxID=135588 RepID=UPI003559FD23|nr:FACT complex subunit SSRP1 [Histomonas meleagridis]KAH0805983.1 FACT complex subunit SSRP1 [Histomonas meleagridis]
MSSGNSFDVIINSSESTLSLEPGLMTFKPKSKGISAQLRAGEIDHAEWITEGQICILQIHTQANHFFAISGFKPSDNDQISNYLEEQFNIKPEIKNALITGTNIAELQFKEKFLTLSRDGNLIMNLPYSKVSQPQVIPPTDLLIVFTPDAEATGETLESISLSVPNESEMSNQDIIREILTRTNLAAGTETYIAEVKEVVFCKPRQRFNVRFCPEILNIYNDELSHRIPYTHIYMVHRLEIPLRKNKSRENYIVISLTRAIRQGNTSYQHLVITTSESEDVEAEGLDHETTMANALEELLRRVGANIIPTNDFYVNPAHDIGTHCQYKNANGYIYLTDDAILYLHSQVLYLPYKKIITVEFQKYKEMLKENKMFDITIVTDNRQHKYTITNIDTINGITLDIGKDEDAAERRNKMLRDSCVEGLKGMAEYIEKKGVTIVKAKHLKRYIEEYEDTSSRGMRAARKNERIIIADESDEDEDFNPNAESSESSEDEEEEEGTSSEKEND